MCKVINTVRSLAWLRRIVRRWRSRAAASVRPNKDVLELDAAVPAGHVALLQQAEEEYGFPSASGPLALPSDEDHLRDVLRRWP
ncbi:hypothetical protein TRIUR3_03946 [Triticum urartu]|uniref:Uncharacterized protein n=1 Tax=Triticum urartu TaxID=4572 RepID=M7ZXI5_TRIUA|nr:hypothetical protein TRIUR3_03946 [Triticum urartu]